MVECPGFGTDADTSIHKDFDEMNTIRLFHLVSKQEAYRVSSPHRGEMGESSALRLFGDTKATASERGPREV